METLVLHSASAALVQDLTHVAWGRTQQVPLFKYLFMHLAVVGLSCSTQALKLAGSVVAAHKLSCSHLCDLSSSTRDGTHVPCIARLILNHWTTKEVPQRKFLIHLGVSR